MISYLCSERHIEQEEEEGECDKTDVCRLILSLSSPSFLFLFHCIPYLIHQTCTRELNVDISVGVGYNLV